MAKKKAKDLKDVPNEELMDFSEIVEPLVKYIRKIWNWKGFKPKGYKAFKANYNDYDGDDQAQMWADKFDGINTSTASSFGFHDQTTLNHVCYDDVNQGRDPLHVLIGACVSFGLNVGEERFNRKLEKARIKHNESVETYCGIIKRALDRVNDAKDPENKTFALEQLTREMETITAIESQTFKISEWLMIF